MSEQYLCTRCQVHGVGVGCWICGSEAVQRHRAPGITYGGTAVHFNVPLEPVERLVDH